MNCMSGIARVVSITVLCAMVLFSSGCATTIALTKNTPLHNIEPDKGLTLLVIETSKDNMGTESIRPVVQNLDVVSARDKKRQMYSVPVDVVSFKDGSVFHLISLTLPAGEYEITGFSGRGLMDKWIEDTDWNTLNRKYQGKFFSLLNASFVVTAGKVAYAGHIKAHMRRRASDSEPLAALMIPLIDQQIAGFYPTTFDITVADAFDDDVARFVAKFPSLQRDGIGKALSVRNVQKKE
ncbi:MAG: hypothetical protein ACYDAA_12720 [Syntrophales bacterium]